jgi:hypothetical protein
MAFGGVMGRPASTRHLSWLQLREEAQTACRMGRGMMGFAFPTASLGTIPFFSLFLTLHIPP